MTHEELLAVIEECRDARGALRVLRRAARLLEHRPAAFMQLEKLLQEWERPVSIDRATRLVVQVLEEENPCTPGVAEAKELLSGLLLATGERAAEEERRRVAVEAKTIV